MYQNQICVLSSEWGGHSPIDINLLKFVQGGESQVG